MADLSAISFGTDTGPTLDNIGTVATPGSAVVFGIDTLINPVSQPTVRSADVMALLERCRIEMMDYFADNLR